MAVLLLTLILALLNIVAGRSIAGGELLEFSCSQRQMYGKYASKDGVHGITFFSGADGYLHVRSFSGVYIIDTSPFIEIDKEKHRSVHIMGYEYIQHSRSAHPDQPVDHDTPLVHVIQDLRSMTEINLLEEAARGVGEKGINGKNTPAAMPFFMFALRITQHHMHAQGLFTGNTTLIRHERQSHECSDSCPPCPDDECNGMCGYGCNCWEFVCGDCCYHTGCADHDNCCRSSFIQTSCLAPISFSCEEHYSCSNW